MTMPNSPDDILIRHDLVGMLLGFSAAILAWGVAKGIRAVQDWRSKLGQNSQD